MEVVVEYINAFDASKYPELSADEALMTLLQTKVSEMRVFMDKMKGGVRHMRSSVDHAGTTYKFSLKLE